MEHPAAISDNTEFELQLNAQYENLSNTVRVIRNISKFLSDSSFKGSDSAAIAEAFAFLEAIDKANADRAQQTMKQLKDVDSAKRQKVEEARKQAAEARPQLVK